MSVTITKEVEFKELFTIFKAAAYRTSEPKGEPILERCKALFQMDYQTIDVANTNGELCSHYPSKLIIPEFEKRNAHNTSSDVIHENIFEAGILRSQINAARKARCRSRFPVPVLLYKGKFICRSATISTTTEVALNYFTEFSSQQDAEIPPDDFIDAPIGMDPGQTSFFNNIRNSDVKLLKTFRVNTIMDFMVEMGKVKYYLSVSSSEKADTENRYTDFSVLALPYPGCEFFSRFHNNSYAAEGLIFDWNQPYIDATISIPRDYDIARQLPIEWDDYKTWDLVKITQNYIKLILKHLQDGNSGLLIHCISGWDRTPLFVSLIRILLWADGSAHQSLSPLELLYLTIAYDWYLFGHNLPDRINKGEDIFFFCFHLLKYLYPDEYGIKSVRPKPKHNSSSSSAGLIPMDGDFDGIGGDSNDGRGSTWSLNSVGSRRSHEEGNGNNFVHHNEESNGTSNSSDIEILGTSASDTRNSPMGKRTSPMSVPISNRQRNESFSSACGSWAVITDTGSLNSTVDHSLFAKGYASGPNRADEEYQSSIEDNGMPPTKRQERIKTLRTLFYSMYCNHVGVGNNFKNGAVTDATLGSLLSGMVEKINVFKK